MSYGNSGDGRLSKNERREAAREKARVLRDEQKKKDRRTKVFLQGGIILASLAIIAIIALVIISSIRPDGPGPANMASDGIRISQGGVALATPALRTGQTPAPNVRDSASKAVDIQLYVDYFCPICGQFEAANGTYITSLLDNGGATIEIHPIAILDRLSQGTKYSTRAANAVACVANYSPNKYYDVNTLLFSPTVQPKENTTGLSDDQLISITTQAKVDAPDKVASCIKNQDFKAWVTNSTARALNGPIPGSNVAKVAGTPTVIVNGLKYDGSVSDLASFRAFVVQAAGTTFKQNSGPTPTPTPSS